MSNIKSEPNLSYYPDDQDTTQVGNLLKNLSLYELYEKLDKKSNNPKKLPACNACESELKVTSAAKTDLVNLCHGVCNIMLNLGDSDIPCGKSSCLGLCNNIKIWIYEHLLKITTKETEVNRFYESLKTIMKGDETKREICNLKLNMNNDNFKNFKFFYDFLYISKEIMDNISYKNDAEVKLYCTHIKEFVRYYNTIKGSCTDSECKYHDMLVMFKKNITRAGQLDDIYKNCNYEKTTCPSGSMEEEIPCLQEKEIKPTFSMQFDHKNNVISIISNIAIFIIPIFGLLSIFYKFTPLGFWLRSRMRKKNNTHKNMSQGKYDILENTSRTEQLYPESKEYNLRYQ